MDRFIEKNSEQRKSDNGDLKSNMDRFIEPVAPSHLITVA